MTRPSRRLGPSWRRCSRSSLDGPTALRRKASVATVSGRIPLARGQRAAILYGALLCVLCSFSIARGDGGLSSPDSTVAATNPDSPEDLGAVGDAETQRSVRGRDLTDTLNRTQIEILLTVVLGMAPLLIMAGSLRAQRLASRFGTAAMAWLHAARGVPESRVPDLGRRRHPRWQWRETLECRRPGDENGWTIKTVDISEGGLGFLSPKAIQIGEIVQFRSPEDSAWIPGRVAYARPDADANGEFRIGIEFVIDPTYYTRTPPAMCDQAS